MSTVHTLVVHRNLLGVFQNTDAWVSPLSPHKSEICWGQTQTALFTNPRNSSVVSWLRLYTSTAGNMGSIPGRKTRVLLATWYSQKVRKEKKKRKYSSCFQRHSTPRSRVGFLASYVPGVSVIPPVPVLQPWKKCATSLNGHFPIYKMGGNILTCKDVR